ncbi:MAG TPA: GMC family oxidoreductase, partial [bacterium]|nr:GMC family oxidoreductase [bacterium]
MTTARDADVCLVGLGAAGAMAAYVLTGAGVRVVALEAGPPRSGREYVMDELVSSRFRNAWGETKFNQELPTWRRNAQSPRQATPYYQRMANGVGGSSLAYAAISFRYHPDDFRARSNTVTRYGAAALPTGSDLTDWPLSYDDVEPYYDLAEELLGVSGQAGNVRGRLLPGGNPFEGPRQRPYRLPPLRTSGLGTLFAEAAAEAGYHPFPMPAAILTQPSDSRAACTYCSFCTRLGCHVGAKGNMLETVVPQALATGNLEIRTGCRALRVVTGARGEVVGVEYLGPAGIRLQPARVVILAAYTFENVRLLLLSRSPRFPNGLGNNAGQVGRYYMTRQISTVSGLFAGRRLNRFTGPSAQGQTIDDFNANNFDHGGLGFIRGGRITAANQFPPIVSSAVLPPEVPRWGRAYKAFLVNHYNSIATLMVDSESLPYTANFLDLDP